MDKEELIRRKDLAVSQVYLDIKKEVMQNIINNSLSNIDPKLLQGMLLTLNYIDSWVIDYETAIARKDEYGN